VFDRFHYVPCELFRNAGEREKVPRLTALRCLAGLGPGAEPNIFAKRRKTVHFRPPAPSREPPRRAAFLSCKNQGASVRRLLKYWNGPCCCAISRRLQPPRSACRAVAVRRRVGAIPRNTATERRGYSAIQYFNSLLVLDGQSHRAPRSQLLAWRGRRRVSWRLDVIDSSPRAGGDHF